MKQMRFFPCNQPGLSVLVVASGIWSSPHRHAGFAGIDSSR